MLSLLPVCQDVLTAGKGARNFTTFSEVWVAFLWSIWTRLPENRPSRVEPHPWSVSFEFMLPLGPTTRSEVSTSDSTPDRRSDPDPRPLTAAELRDAGAEAFQKYQQFTEYLHKQGSDSPFGFHKPDIPVV